MNTRQRGLTFVLVHAAARNTFFYQILGMGLALVGTGLLHIQQNHFQASHGSNIGDARAHHAGAQNTDLAQRDGRNILGPPGAFAGLGHGKEQPNHVLAFRRRGGSDQIADFNRQASIDIDLAAFKYRGHNVALRRIITIGALVQHGVAGGEGLLTHG